MTLCSDQGPKCPRCGAIGIYCTLPAGHAGDHSHPKSGMCAPITWKVRPVVVTGAGDTPQPSQQWTVGRPLDLQGAERVQVTGPGHGARPDSNASPTPPAGHP